MAAVVGRPALELFFVVLLEPQAVGVELVGWRRYFWLEPAELELEAAVVAVDLSDRLVV